MDGLVSTIKTLVAAPLFSTLITLVFTPALATYFGVRAFRLQSKEIIDSAITWQWEQNANGLLSEEPFLAIQNRSAIPAFIVRARYLKGVIIRREAARYAFAYADAMEGNFPLHIAASGVSSFPLSEYSANTIAEKAAWYSRWLGYILKRSYIWVEIRTISGHKLLVAANDATPFKDRPLWLQGRWMREPIPEWMKPRPPIKS